MSDQRLDSFDRSDLSPKSRRIAWAVSMLMNTMAVTFRWRLHDPEGLRENPPAHPMIWTLWHNRIFAAVPAYRRYLSSRRGAVLSSASKDGEIIAAIVARANCAAVRGSSSRRGVSALLGLLDWVRNGYDVLVIPDGPRGPRYQLGPGIIKLAQKSDARILPIRIEYGSSWLFKSWDHFRLPKPFTTVDVYFEPLYDVPSSLDEEEFEAHRIAVEQTLNPENETD